MYNKILALSNAGLDNIELNLCLRIITGNESLTGQETRDLIQKAKALEIPSEEHSELSSTLKQTNQLLKILVEDKSSGRPWTQEQLTYLVDNIDLNNLQTIRRIADELNNKFDCGRTPFAVACRIIDILTNKEDCLSENRMLISKKEVRSLQSKISFLEDMLGPIAEQTPKRKKSVVEDDRPLMDRIYEDISGEPF